MSLLQDFRYALRLFAKAPGFVFLVVLTLACGIGANTMMFSVARAVFAPATNYPDLDRLVFVSRGYPGYPQGGGNFTYPAYRDILQQNTSLDEFAAFQEFGALALTDGPEPQRVNINYITPSYLSLLGARTRLGRIFRREEDRWEDADPVVVISQGFWQREFVSASDVVGRVIHLNQQPFTVIGVAESKFRDAPGEIDTGEAIDAWLPLGLSHRMTGYSALNDRNGAILWGLGHLKSGITLQSAQGDLAAICRRLEKAYPATDSGFTLVANPLKERLVGQFYRPVWLLMGGSVFILLIACANVANLELARLLERHRELAVRSALGASTARLAGQMLIENVLLMTISAVGGILIAVWGVRALRSWGQLNLPALIEFRIDGVMLLVCVLVSAITLFFFGVGPALNASRVDLRNALNQSGRSAVSQGHRRATKLLIVSEVSMALILLVGTGLLLKSFRRMTTIDYGFDTKDLLTLRLDLNAGKYDSELSRAQFGKNLQEKLDKLPGIRSATLWGPGMPGRETWVLRTVPEGRPADDPRNIVMSTRHSVNPGALSNMGIPLLRGREFTWQDDAHAPLVGIVSESTAKASWPGEDPLGKRFIPTARPDPVMVVGVAKDVRLRQRLELSDAALGIAPGGLGPQLDVYLPFMQRANRSIVMALRVSADPAAVMKETRAAVLSLDSTLPLYDIATLQDRLAAQDTPSLALAAVTALYAIVALFLASIGLFGVLARNVGRRTQELGVRMALGAVPRDLLLMVLREGLWMTLVGIVGGLAGAVLLTRVLANLLFGVSATDPIVYLGISTLLLCVAVAACYLPARRATKLDPLVALRHE